MKTALKVVFMFGLMAALAFAQGDPFTSTASRISLSMTTLARIIAGILAIYCGIKLMYGDSHGVAQVSGFVIGAVFALFAPGIISLIAG